MAAPASTKEKNKESIFKRIQTRSGPVFCHMNYLSYWGWLQCQADYVALMYLFNPDCCREGKPTSAREGLRQREHSSWSRGSKPSGTLGSWWRWGASTMLCFILLAVRPTQLHGKLPLPGPTSVADPRRVLMADRPCKCEPSAASHFHIEAKCAETWILHKRIQSQLSKVWIHAAV